MCPSLFQVLADKLGNKTNVPVITGNFLLIGENKKICHQINVHQNVTGAIKKNSTIQFYIISDSDKAVEDRLGKGNNFYRAFRESYIASEMTSKKKIEKQRERCKADLDVTLSRQRVQQEAEIEYAWDGQ